MNTAERFLQAWNNVTKTISVGALAQRIDPQVVIKRRKVYPTGATLTFADGSKIETRGKGSSFRIAIKEA